MTTMPKRRGRPPKPVQLFTFGEESRSLAEWESIKRFSPGTLALRMKRGMSFDEALNTPLRNYGVIEESDNSNQPESSPTAYAGWAPTLVYYKGEWITLRQWCNRMGVERSELSKRVNLHGWDFHRALNEPKE